MRSLASAWAACVLAVATGVGVSAAATDPGYAPVLAGVPLKFPRDFGSHPQFRTEWWYLTGWLRTPDNEPLGFQITFFRTKPAGAAANPSAFAPNQLLIAHCALSDPTRGRLWQDQRIRRAGMELAEATEGDLKVWIENWSLSRAAQGYRATLDAENFSLDLAFSETQPMLINGDAGASQKGPSARSASYYYSLPHLTVAGEISRQGVKTRVSGEAWFDHEWSSEYLDAEATGWDWIGINLKGGAALMAFRIRGPDGHSRWAGGTYRDETGAVQVLRPEDVDFQFLRRWVSPRTGISYPVEWRVRAGARELHLLPLMDDQENDTRLSTGAIYWEGAVSAYDQEKLVGRGYLELTGYGERLRLR